MKDFPYKKTDEEWKSALSAKQFEVLRNKGTEYPHTGVYNLHFEEGAYFCAGCKQKLFESEAKFNSSCGWPSFDKAIPGSVDFERDTSFGMIRTEVLCSNCGSHLGHVFNDGPTDTGERFCINSVCLNFNPPSHSAMEDEKE